MKAVAVSAVKGGVGKTLISLNLAYCLREKGYPTALLDADIDNSNFAQFTGATGEIEVDPETMTFKPYRWRDIEVFSMSLVAGQRSVSMTADRYSQMLDDVVKRSRWNAEYWVIDLPSGAHDIFRTAHIIFAENLVGDVIVTQPSMVDATRKVLTLHRTLDIPVLGAIENMSYFVCEKHREPKVYYPFGPSTIDEIAKEYGIEVFGKIPLSITMAEKIAAGEPIFDEALMAPVRRAAEKVIRTEVKGTGFLAKFREKVTATLRREAERILAQLIVSTNRLFDLDRWSKERGFTHGKPFDLVVTDESGHHVLVRAHLRLTGGKLKLVRRPARVDLEGALSFRTLARIILGKRKLSDGQVVPYDAMDAWLNNDFRAYGAGYFPRVLHLLRALLSDERIIGEIEKRYGSVLERWC